MWSMWISFAIGVWVFLSGLIPSLQAEWNLIIFGAAAAVFGFISFRDWQGIANGIGGIWLFLSGIWFMIMSPMNFLITGFAMGLLGIWGALAETKHHGEISHGTT